MNPNKPGVLLANSIALDVTPQNAAPHLGLFCLLKVISLKHEIKLKNKPGVAKMKVNSPK